MSFKHALRKLIYVVVVATTVVVFASNPAMAAKAATGPFGNDISYPQCGRPYPSGQSFGIIGLNGGLTNNDNSCFGSEWAWAYTSKGGTGQPIASLYVNTGNPELAGTWWPNSNSTQDGQVTVTVPSQYNNGNCDGTNSRACAFVYGYSKAHDDATRGGLTTAAGYRWWLDVETVNSWSTKDLVQNKADLEGMVAFFHDAGAGSVGLYSTSYQLGKIIGTSPDFTQNTSRESLAGLPSWLAGASSYSNAKSFCAKAGLTPGSQVQLAQYISGRLDYDVSCI